MRQAFMNSTLGLLASTLAMGLACTVPEEVKVSLYDQGDALHGGPAAFLAAQGVINGLQLREVRFERMDLQELTTRTSCRLGIFLEGSEETPDGFVGAGGSENEICDDLGATEARNAAGVLWTRQMLPYPSDIASQQAQADYAREYALATRMLGIEAEEWDVPNHLHSCIEERIAELSAHKAYVSGLACEAYRDSSSLEVDHQRKLLAGARIRADQRLADARRSAPVVPESLWEAEGINGRMERNVTSLPFSTTMILEGTVGMPITLLRGETFTAQLTQDDGYVAIRLWRAEGGNVVASDMAMGGWQENASVSWTPARTETYVLAISAYDGPRSVRVGLQTDGTGALSEPRQQELEQLSKRSAQLSASNADVSTLVEMLRWEDEGAQDACVQAALFSIEEYALHSAVQEALSECSRELEHRIQIRERVLELAKDKKAEDD